MRVLLYSKSYRREMPQEVRYSIVSRNKAPYGDEGELNLTLDVAKVKPKLDYVLRALIVGQASSRGSVRVGFKPLRNIAPTTSEDG
jgi:hypothetical protein